MSGGVTAAAVVVGAYSSHKATKAAKGAANTQAAIATTELEFEKAKYAEQKELDAERQKEWEDMYGNVEENLAHSIDKISARSYEVRGHTELEKQYSDVSRRLTENLAARNISGGQQVSGQTQLLSNLASNKAAVSSEAESKALQDKSNMFMHLGLSQKRGVQLPDSSGIRLANNSLSSAVGRYGKAESDGYTNMGKEITSGMGMYNAQQPRPIGPTTYGGGAAYTPSGSATPLAMDAGFDRQMYASTIQPATPIMM